MQPSLREVQKNFAAAEKSVALENGRDPSSNLGRGVDFLSTTFTKSMISVWGAFRVANPNFPKQKLENRDSNEKGEKLVSGRSTKNGIASE